MTGSYFLNRPSLLNSKDDKKMVINSKNRGMCEKDICDGSGLVSMRQSTAYTGMDCEVACDCSHGIIFKQKYRYASYFDQVQKGWFQAQWQVDRIKNMREAYLANEKAPF